MKMRLFTLFVLLTLGGLRLAAQVAPGELPVEIPESYQDFWERYSKASAEDDEDDMDAAVRAEQQDAIEVLELFLDATARFENPTLTGEARSLAWSLDRVTRGERYIERVRFVLDLERRDRGARRIASFEFIKAIRESDAAIESGSTAAFEAVLKRLDEVAELYGAIGDYESMLQVFRQGAWVTQRRGLAFRWERAGWYEKAVKVGELLPYRDADLIDSRDALEALVAAGFDPSQPKSAAPSANEGEDVGTVGRPSARGTGSGDSSDGGGDTGVAGGRSLDAFADGSKEEVEELEPKVSKKGLDMASMPNFYPDGQFLVWPYTGVELEGPADFDSQRGAVTYKPFGQHWQLSRDGQSKFLIDTDRDGETDIEFTGTSTPTLLEVPGPEKGQSTPLLVCVPSDRDQVLGFGVNYAPTEQYARLRFQPAGYLEAKVRGEKLKLADLNMDGEWGAPREFFGDVTTEDDDELFVSWWEPDGVQVGKAKVADPLSPVMKIKGKWYRTTVDSTALTIATRQLDLLTGEVKLDYEIETLPTHLVAMEVGEKLGGAVFNLMPAKKNGKVELPVGTYKIVMGQVSTGRKTSTDLVRIYTGSSPTFEVKAGETTTLEMGAPFKLIFSHRQEGKERVVKADSFRVFGRFGEEYAKFFDEPLKPEISARKIGGVDLVEERPMRFPGIEDWQSSSDGERALHFPVDFRFDNPDRSDVEVKAFQEEHGLLGGPIESDWIP
ncbi:MAG: hypothetical protein DHS20C15_02620 [Planctomycetota bacterium]|nr:MAG: hypothetical protein DHS20C15_02620 [Planctomycetota bacterium]